MIDTANTRQTRPRELPSDLTLRSATAADAHGMADIVNLPGFRIANTRGPFLPVSDMQRMIDGLTTLDRLIVAVSGQVLVGFIFFHRLRGRCFHTAKLGMGVHDDWIGRGIGTALLSSVIDMADNWLALRRLELAVASDNAAAIRLYTRQGFELEGTLRGAEFRDGRYLDQYVMARLRVPDLQ